MKKIFLKIYFFFRNYLNETISFFITIAGATLAYSFYQEPGLQFVSLGILAVTSYLIILFHKLKGRDFSHIFFDKYQDKEGWVGSGSFEYYPNDEAFIIKDSDAGFIFSKCLTWIDYEMKCEFKIIKSTLGILIRAIDLSNKLMLQININAKGIRPHLWANGGYLVNEPKESGLEFESKLKEGRWYKLQLRIHKESVKIQIAERNIMILEKHWDIPTALLSFPIREKDKKQGDISNPMGMLDIRKDYSYGTIGFRNGHGEKALVRNLLVKKI
jgi:hypothetical protein